MKKLILSVLLVLTTIITFNNCNCTDTNAANNIFYGKIEFSSSFLGKFPLTQLDHAIRQKKHDEQSRNSDRDRRAREQDERIRKLEKERKEQEKGINGLLNNDNKNNNKILIGILICLVIIILILVFNKKGKK